jgi:hypothetical protein
MKVADVPFPFPYGQMQALLVILFSCFLPVWVAIFTQSFIAGPIISFMLFLSFWCVNEVAKDLENPFGQDINDIPLFDFHKRFCVSMAETHRALDVVHGGKVDGLSGDTGASIFLGLDGEPPKGDFASPGGPKTFSPRAGEALGPTPPLRHPETSGLPPEAGAPFPKTSAASLGAALRGAAAASCPCAPEAATVAAVPSSSSTACNNAPAGSGKSSGWDGGRGGVEVIDRQLAQIGWQMEQHLAHIVRELDQLTSKVSASQLAVPAFCTSREGASERATDSVPWPFSQCTAK